MLWIISKSVVDIIIVAFLGFDILFLEAKFCGKWSFSLWFGWYGSREMPNHFRRDGGLWGLSARLYIFVLPSFSQACFLRDTFVLHMAKLKYCMFIQECIQDANWMKTSLNRYSQAKLDGYSSGKLD